MEYAKHCQECEQFGTCKQKQFMTADTEPVDGYADFVLIDHVCHDCLDPKHDHESLDNPELDSPAHCSICHIPLNCQLTTDGVDYVRELLANSGGCCQELWPVLFADYLE